MASQLFVVLLDLYVVILGNSEFLNYSVSVKENELSKFEIVVFWAIFYNSQTFTGD